MKFRKRNGFSLIELLVVVSIIVILFSMLVVGINKAMAQAAYVNCQSNMKALGSLINQYALQNKGVLPEFSEYKWIGMIEYFKEGQFGYKPREEYLAEYPGMAGEPPGDYYIIKPREDRLFVCPTAEKAMINLQGVRSNYAGMSSRDYQSLDTIENPLRSIMLLEYDADAGGADSLEFGGNNSEFTYITDTIKSPLPTPNTTYRVALNHGNGSCGNILFVAGHVECV
ncbi:MAG: type II secretion system protein, partial [Planctomycetota bacterium]|nr:type II secretion system protein [Planctomycetota bacterium]